MRFLFKLLLLPITLLAGCSGDSSTSPGQTGNLKISLTDSPATYEAVNITFSEISANINEDWITVNSEPITVNLLEWNNGKSIVIGSAQVPAGQYSQIRLIIDDAEVVVDGQTHKITVPSGVKTGLKLGPEFTVVSGSTYELVVDFDANRSIVTTGPPNNPNGYILKPTVRVVPKAITGSISGVIANPQNSAIAYAIIGMDTLTSSIVDTTNGSFILAYLPEGVFTVSVNDTTGLSFVTDNVEVIAGSNQNLGTITLQ